jgi:AcrR family transcriptional regulator
LIVETALRLAQGTSPSALSFRNLGRELGVDPTAVYRHFDSKAQLLAVAADRLLERLVDAAPAGLGWSDRLRAGAVGYLDALIEHPVLAFECGGYHVTGGPGEAAARELILGALDEAGLPPEEAADYYVLLVAFTPAMATTIAAITLGRAEPAPWPASLATDLGPTPMVDRLVELGAALDPRTVTLHGVDVIIDAVARRAAEVSGRN